MIHPLFPHRRARRAPGSRMRGAATVEFAVTVIYWLALTIGVIEFGRIAFLWSTAYEATRLGARTAVVCGTGDADVRNRMKSVMPLLTDENISISFPAAMCTIGNCPPAVVSIQNLTVATIIPLAPFSFTLPAASTSLPPETRRASSAPATCS